MVHDMRLIYVGQKVEGKTNRDKVMRWKCTGMGNMRSHWKP